jgi:hypothetical protein
MRPEPMDVRDTIPMADAEPEASGSLRARALEEFRAYWMIVLYLWLALGLFYVYRRLVLADTGVEYLHYGIALVEAMVIGKVVLVGRMFGFTRRFEDRPLAVPVIFKSILFGLLVMLFGAIEHLVGGWIHGQGLLGGLREIATVGAHELAARGLMLVFAFIPFFAFCELGRVLGMPRLAAMFFSNPGASAGTSR